MDLEKVLGFPLERVRIEGDGTSTPPEVSPLSPPSQRIAGPSTQRLFEPTRIEGLHAPPAPPVAPLAQAAAPAPARVPAPPAAPVLAAARMPAPSVAPAPSADVAIPPPAASPSLPEPALEAQPPAAHALPGHVARGWATVLQARFDGVLRRVGAEARPGRRWLLLALGPALAGFVATVFVAGRGSPPAAGSALRNPPTTSAWAAAASGARRDPLEPCVRQRDAERIASGISPTFALEARAIAGGVDVLVGTATSSGAALGLRLNATTLLASELLRDSGARELLGVVPTPGAEPPGFTVDRSSVGGYREWRTLPERPSWALTRTNRALHLRDQAQNRATELWPLAAGEELSRPKVEWQAERLVVLLRRGGRQGKLALGWLNAQTLERSVLRELPLAGNEVGLPSLASEPRGAAVAAAVRAASTEPWHVELAWLDWSGQARRLRVPALQPQADRESFAPSLAATGDAGWFLQWTEGQAGLRRVRGVTLDAEFRALGEVITLSPAGANAGGGSVVYVDEGLLSLFLVQRDGNYELWATTLSCR